MEWLKDLRRRAGDMWNAVTSDSQLDLHEAALQQDWDRVERLCDEAAAKGKSLPIHHHFRGLVQMERHSLNLAVESFRESLRVEPLFVESRMALAECFRRKNVPYQAIEEYKTVLETLPGFLPAQWRLGELYLEMKAPKQAREAFAVIVAAHPANHEAKVNLAVCAYLMGDVPAVREVAAQLKEHPKQLARVQQMLDRVPVELTPDSSK